MLAPVFLRYTRRGHYLHADGCSILTLGQYLQRSRRHLTVIKFYTLKTFDSLKKKVQRIGLPMWRLPHLSEASFWQTPSQVEADEKAIEIILQSIAAASLNTKDVKYAKGALNLLLRAVIPSLSSPRSTWNPLIYLGVYCACIGT